MKKIFVPIALMGVALIGIAATFPWVRINSLTPSRVATIGPSGLVTNPPDASITSLPVTLSSGKLIGRSTAGTGAIEERDDAPLQMSGFAFDPVYGFSPLYAWGSGATLPATVVSSTFSSWAWGIGSTTNQFNSLRLSVYPFDAGFIPTTVIVRLKIVGEVYPPTNGLAPQGATNPATWSVIASVTNDYSMTALAINTLTVQLPSTISTTSNLFVEVISNGRIGLPRTTVSPSPDYGVTPSPVYITGSSLTSTNWIVGSNPDTKQSLVELGVNPGVLVDFTPTSDLLEKLGLTNSEAITFSLCPTNYAVSGTEFNLYFRNVARSSLFARTVEDFDFNVTCTKGAQFADFFRVTPEDADAGTVALSIAATAPDTTSTYSGQFKIVADSAGNGATRKLLVIGDSTTAGGQVVTELNRISGTNGFKLDTIGTQGSGTNKHEGRSGYTIARFYTGDANGVTPFTNLVGAFDFNYYLTNNSLTMASNDWVFVNLGVNDVFNQTSDSGAATVAGTYLTTFSNMVVNIRTVVPGIRVGLCVTIPPAYSQDAFGDDYGTGQTFARYNRNRAIFAEYLAAYTQTGVFRIPISVGLDTLHNFASTTGVWNSRNSGTWTYLNNGVHPDQSGYEQIADQMWAALKCLEP